jgi:hypothetical protein
VIQPRVLQSSWKSYSLMLLAQDGARTRRLTKPRCHARKLFHRPPGLRVYLALIQRGRRPSNSAVWWCRSWSRRCNLERSSSPRCVASRPGFTPLRPGYTAVYILVKRLESVVRLARFVFRWLGRVVAFSRLGRWICLRFLLWWPTMRFR